MSPISTWMTDDGELDLFDSVLARRSPARYWEDIHPGSSRHRIGGIPIDVASIDTLIASKLAVGRPKDLDTAEELRRIAADRALRDVWPSTPTTAPRWAEDQHWPQINMWEEPR